MRVYTGLHFVGHGNHLIFALIKRNTYKTTFTVLCARWMKSERTSDFVEVNNQREHSLDMKSMNFLRMQDSMYFVCRCFSMNFLLQSFIMVWGRLTYICHKCSSPLANKARNKFGAQKSTGGAYTYIQSSATCTYTLWAGLCLINED